MSKKKLLSALRQPANGPSVKNTELSTPFGEQIAGAETLLRPAGTEQVGAMTRNIALAHETLVPSRDLAKTETYRDGAFIFGRTIEDDVDGNNPALLASHGEGHIFLCAETRRGKSERFLVPNLAKWKGSALVIDPKGYLASMTAERRGDKDTAYCDAMGQKVFVLDPARISRVPDNMFACFNPLDILKADDPKCLAKARSLAASLLPDEDDKTGDKYWDNEGRDLLATVMIHVATAEDSPHPRTLNTVYKLLRTGEEELKLHLNKQGKNQESTPFSLFFATMQANPVLDGYVRDGALDLYELYQNASKQWQGIRSHAKQCLSWVATKQMKESLSTSTFDFEWLRTKPEGVTVYVTVEDMELDWRWLRVVIDAFMSASKGDVAPATDHRTLMILDEFPQMKNMKSVEKAIGGLAEYGVRICAVVQSIVQLQQIYPDSWELFISNADLQIYFGTNSVPTAKYISERLGEKEIIKVAKSIGLTANTQTSYSQSDADAIADGTADAEGGGSSENIADGEGSNHSTAKGRGHVHKESLSYYAGLGWMPMLQGAQVNRSKQVTNGTNKTRTATKGNNTSWNKTKTKTNTHTHTTQEGGGEGQGVNIGHQEQFHKVPVLSPAAILTTVAKVTDEADPPISRSSLDRSRWRTTLSCANSKILRRPRVLSLLRTASQIRIQTSPD